MNLVQSKNYQPHKTPQKKPNNRRRPGCLIFLAILLILIFTEGKRANRNWNAYSNHWEEKGEIFDLEKLIPPYIPDKENFAASPIIAELFNNNTPPRLKKLALSEISNLQQPVRPTASPPSQKSHWKALGIFPYTLAEHISPPNSVSSENEAAKFILKQLKPLDLLFNELEKSSKLPKARFPLKYDEFMTMEYEHGKLLREAIKTLALKSRAQLTAGNSQAATLNLLETLRLSELTGSEPTLMSHLIQLNFCKSPISVLHYGLEKNLFATNDLTTIQTALKSQKLESRLLLALRTERALTISLIDSCSQGRLPSAKDPKEPASFKLLFRTLDYLGILKPFTYNNKLNYSKFIQEHGLSNKDEVNLSRINFDTIMNIETDLETLKSNSLLPITPYSLFLVMPAAPYKSIVAASSKTAARIDLARVAIALELYRREHGSYPDSLSPLAPSYIDALPPDLITGDPLHYRLKTDGTPLIYSVGINQIDENGLLKKDRTLGDWTWQYTLPPDFKK